MASILLITSSGSVLNYLKIYGKDVNTALIKCAFEMMFPMFNIFIIGQTISHMGSLAIVWQLQVGTLLTTALSLLLGFLLIALIPVPDSSRYTTVSIVAFSNLGNIPLLLVESSCKDYGPLRGYEDCPLLPGFVMTCTIASNIMVWGFGYSLILKDAHAQAKSRVENFFSAANQDATSLMSATFDEPLLPPKVDVKTILKNAFCALVPMSSMIGLFFGMLPYVDVILFNHDAPFAFITRAMLEVGFLGIIFTQQVLGSNIKEQFDKPQTISPILLAGLAIARLVVAPIIVQFIVHLLVKEQILSLGVGFIIVAGAACPSALSTMGLNQLLDVGMEVTSIAFMVIYPMSVL
eukprot:CAMPEP_0204912088 /NCGR_PEP_ID=MMETSP1397-20131031/10286_1 /ASSEMBLY_ACC=CAM_ASM_000891 /TAXON_ID=49980 /ORGANISM="Climacostomum Climacostomum virens, Strain Stock W-24" /LENGTH=349 /DNA_ID=CAMNT_0052082861 /DNA_START=30 /DNA_END=1075 /DNA_ORIENTATION=-